MAVEHMEARVVLSTLGPGRPLLGGPAAGGHVAVLAQGGPGYPFPPVAGPALPGNALGQQPVVVTANPAGNATAATFAPALVPASPATAQAPVSLPPGGATPLPLPAVAAPAATPPVTGPVVAQAVASPAGTTTGLPVAGPAGPAGMAAAPPLVAGPGPVSPLPGAQPAPATSEAVHAGASKGLELLAADGTSPAVILVAQDAPVPGTPGPAPQGPPAEAGAAPARPQLVAALTTAPTGTVHLLSPRPARPGVVKKEEGAMGLVAHLAGQRDSEPEQGVALLVASVPDQRTWVLAGDVPAPEFHEAPRDTEVCPAPSGLSGWEELLAALPQVLARLGSARAPALALGSVGASYLLAAALSPALEKDERERREKAGRPAGAPRGGL